MRRGHLALGALIALTAVAGSMAAAMKRSSEPPTSPLPCATQDVEFSRLSTQYPPVELGPGPRFPRVVRLSDAAVVGVVRDVTTHWNLRPGERPSISREYRYPTIYRRVDIDVERWLFPEGMKDRVVTLTVEGGNRSFLLRPDEVRQINRLNPGSIPPRERRVIRSEPWTVHFAEGEPVALLLFEWSFPFATGERQVLTTSAHGKYLIDARCVLRNAAIRSARRPVREAAPRTLTDFVAAVREHAGVTPGR